MLKDKKIRLLLSFLMIFSTIFTHLTLTSISSDSSHFMLLNYDYHGILSKYSEVIVKNTKNIYCKTNKILFNNSFAVQLTNLDKSTTFECKSLPRNEYILETIDLMDETYQLNLNVNVLQKLYINVSLDQETLKCYAQKFEKAEGNSETGENALLMSNQTFYFNSSNKYRVIVDNHG